MTPFAILLRVLLSLSLILNGTGTAMAATRMLIDHAATSATEPVDATANVAVAAPCHHHAGMAANAHEASTAIADDANKAVKSRHPPRDCCKSGNCGCACLLATPAVVAVVSLPAAVVGRDANAWVVMHGHASPTLAHLIRPPIG